MFLHSLSVISVCGYKRSNLHEVTVERTWGLLFVTTTPHTLWTMLTRRCNYHKYLRTKGLGSLMATAIFTNKKMKFPVILRKTLAAGHASQIQVLYMTLAYHSFRYLQRCLKKWKKKTRARKQTNTTRKQSSKANDKTCHRLSVSYTAIFLFFFN